jgi:hypothetical protein
LKWFFKCRLVLCLRVRFTRSNKYCCLELQQKHFFIGRAHHQCTCATGLQEAALYCFLCGENPWTLESCSTIHVNSGAWSDSKLKIHWIGSDPAKKKFIFNFNFIRKTSVKHYSITLHKLDRNHLMTLHLQNLITILILFLIIFYLMLLQS